MKPICLLLFTALSFTTGAMILGLNKKAVDANSDLPASAERSCRKAREACQKEEYETALSHVNEALRIRADYTPAILLRCDIYTAMGNYRAALEDENKIINSAVNNEEKGRFLGCRALLQLALRNYDAAIRDSSEAIRLGNTRGIVYQWRAEGYNGLQLWDNAIADASVAIRLGDNLTGAYEVRADAYVQKDLYDNAVQDLSRAIAIQPTSKRYLLRGLAQLCKGDIFSATRDGDAALALDPKKAEAHFLLARCWAKTGNPQRASFHNQKYAELLREQDRK